MPQDIRVSPDGKVFFVAEMMAGGVYVIDGDAFTEIDVIPTGIGTHGLYPSRDGRKLYVANRGSSHIGGPPKGKGSISVIDFATRRVETTWPIPGGGSPDMGNVSADGKVLWLSGRYDNVVYAIDTATGQVTTIPVGREPHGLTVWPQPGRYSLGHTGQHALRSTIARVPDYGARRSSSRTASAMSLLRRATARLCAATSAS